MQNFIKLSRLQWFMGDRTGQQKKNAENNTGVASTGSNKSHWIYGY